MAKHTSDPVRHIITFRVNSEEKKVIKKLAEKSGYTVSCFLRRKLLLLGEYE